MFGLLNLGSLILGLIAWILPVINLLQYKKNPHRNLITSSVISNGACSVSLCFQIFYNYHLVKIADWAALMDTIDVVAFAAASLLIVTIILNAITLAVYHGRATN
jgi:cytochrome c oxidase subunit 4